tara:strand:+ start:136 stop:1683 length:1548 start_codon:yes stop_codon:yes gene_type:complete
MSSNKINSSNFLYKKFKHDLKNPINAMIGYSEYIIEDIESDDYIIHITDINSIFKICKMINDKIELSFKNIDDELVDIDIFQFEVRSNLCSVIGLIEMILDKRNNSSDSNDDDEFSNCISNIYKSCKTLLEIIENIKIYIKESLKKNKINTLDSLSNDQYKSFKNKINTVKYTGKILIIDDDVLNAELMFKILDKLDHEVTMSHNADDALNAISSKHYDLILLDIIMPDINGIELLQMIKKNNHYFDVPVIMLSALDDLESIVDCINLGADDYITKPIDKILLNARINSCLEKKEYRDKEKDYLKRIKEEEKKSNDLLLNIMPESIAERLKAGEINIADRFENVSVLFADITDFTSFSSNVSPKVIVEELNNIFSVFDDLVDKYNAEKIKTIGDNYMIASGIPYKNRLHAETIIDLALEMNEAVENINKDLGIKIGISSGEVVAGVIGKRKFIYDLWGDTVNIASRMEKYGENHKIHVSSDTYNIVKNKYNFSDKNVIDVKGKGEMETFFLKDKK